MVSYRFQDRLPGVICKDKKPRRKRCSHQPRRALVHTLIYGLLDATVLSDILIFPWTRHAQECGPAEYRH